MFLPNVAENICCLKLSLSIYKINTGLLIRTYIIYKLVTNSEFFCLHELCIIQYPVFFIENLRCAVLIY